VRSFGTSCLLRPYRSLRDLSNPLIPIPLAFGDLSPNQPVDWNYSYVPTRHVDGRSIATVSTAHIPLEGYPTTHSYSIEASWSRPWRIDIHQFLSEYHQHYPRRLTRHAACGSCGIVTKQGF
jgi:hypothetical protein